MRNIILLAIIAFGLAHNTLAVTCPAGQYSATGFDTDNAGTGCTKCAVGTYATQAGTITCTDCVVGTSTLSPGASDPLSCTLRACVAGTSSTSGFDSDGYGADCTPCAVGTYSAAQATSCTVCTAGTSTPSTGAANSSACLLKACVAGKFSISGFDTDGNGAGCTACAAGTYAAAQATSCTDCTAGTSTPTTTSTACIFKPCVAGKYSATGYDTDGRGKGCNPCPANSSSSAGVASINVSACSCNDKNTNALTAIARTCACKTGYNGAATTASPCIATSTVRILIATTSLFISLFLLI